RQVHGGQRGLKKLREGDVVETRDAELPGNRDSALPGSADHTEGQDVVRADDRRDLIRLPGGPNRAKCIDSRRDRDVGGGHDRPELASTRLEGRGKALSTLNESVLG